VRNTKLLMELDRLKSVYRRSYLSEFASSFSGYALEIELLWKEYEKQETPESRWVKIADRLLPFLMNMASEGKA